MFNKLYSLVLILLISSCSSTGIGERFADSVTSFLLKIYVGKDYNTVATNTRFTNDLIPKRVKIIGSQLSEKTLPGGNTSIFIYFLKVHQV